MIQKATKKEVPIIANMAVMMWDNDTVEKISETFIDIINDDNGIIFFISIDNQPIGFAQCELRHDYVEGTANSPVGYLEGIFIKKEYRKHGYAKELLKECEVWAKEKGCSEFASDCEVHNEDSFYFHLKAGFSEAARIICFSKQI